MSPEGRENFMRSVGYHPEEYRPLLKELAREDLEKIKSETDAALAWARYYEDQNLADWQISAIPTGRFDCAICKQLVEHRQKSISNHMSQHKLTIFEYYKQSVVNSSRWTLLLKRLQKGDREKQESQVWTLTQFFLFPFCKK